MREAPNENLREASEGAGGDIREPARLLIMAYLSVVEEADLGFLVRQTGLTAENVSSHLNGLTTDAYVDRDETFGTDRPRILYRLSLSGRRALDRHREHLDQLFDLSPEVAP